MKFCIVGAGSVGGYLAVRLARAGHRVCVIARGSHLAAIRTHGLKIVKNDGAVLAAPSVDARESAAGLPAQDVVILAVKAHQIAAVAPTLVPLIGPQTLVLPLQNGIPWWYFDRHGGPFDGHRLETVDPGGVIAAHIPVDRIVGCVTRGAYEVASPGVVHNEDSPGDRFPIGELDRSVTPRLQALSRTLEGAAIRAPVMADIRAEKWLKAWGNLALNPIGALCHASLGEIHAFAPTRALATRMMTEAQAIASRLGITFPVALESRLARAAELGAVKTSTQQDVEAGRPLEIEALVGAVLEIGQLVQVEAPQLQALHACTLLLDRIIVRDRVRFAPEPVPLTPPPSTSMSHATHASQPHA